MKVRLADIREKQGLRLEDIADELGVAISTVQRYEKQTMSMPSEKLPAIATAYKCSIVDIFCEPAPTLPPQVVRIWGRIPSAERKRALRVLSTFLPDDEAASGPP